MTSSSLAGADASPLPERASLLSMAALLNRMLHPLPPSSTHEHTCHTFTNAAVKTPLDEQWSDDVRHRGPPVSVTNMDLLDELTATLRQLLSVPSPTSIDQVEMLASPLGLSLNPAKCCSIHLSGTTPVGTRPTTFRVAGTAIPHGANHEPHRFLFRAMGFRVLNAYTTMLEDAIEKGHKLLSSMLALWQRLDALRSFVFLAPLVECTLYFPVNATGNYIYGHARSGAAAVPVAVVLSDICRVDSACKLPTSLDREVRDLAFADLYAVVMECRDVRNR
ncbi:hypothetical protein HPB50_007060 [Hyalomma asiaticum]|uniref:Uncharacterized protein n=1 Tax=Hyalomma asiaticum TaxID=266040 RepID=A0ACB7SNX2_HYAAI|nr:hypothetical protein HPB50_007060 [Hyalomma asiaticum]